MPWLATRFRPGFAVDLTSWSTTIESNGRLQQTVLRYPSDHTEQHVELLAPKQIELLRTLIAATEFAAIERFNTAKNYAITDLPIMEICVADGMQPNRFVEIFEPWFVWNEEGFNCPAIHNAMKVWEAIIRYSPWRADRS